MSRRPQQYDDVPIPGLVVPKAKVAHTEPQKPLKVVGSGWCPGCRFSKKTATGLLESGEHLIWRPHTKPTWSGAVVDCMSSGVRLCVMAPLDKHDGKRAACSCAPDS